MNALYPSFLKGLFLQSHHWLNDDIVITLFDDTATYDSTNRFLADINGGQIVTSAPLTGKFVTDDTVEVGSDPVDYPRLTSSSMVHVAVMHFTDGRLIAWMDRVNGFDFEPTGGHYTLTPGGLNQSYFRMTPP
jgi:hypothetical protein